MISTAELKELETGVDTSKEVELSEDEKTIEAFVSRRVDQMQEYRKQLKIEEKWKEADLEYVPSEIDFSDKRKHFETDEDQGQRTRLVPIADADEDWRSNNSDPMLASKIQTALSIIIDQNPEAELTAYGKKFRERTNLAYAMWKRNWGISGAKEVYKLFIFDLAKYGWAAGRVHPLLRKYDKDIYVEKGDGDTPNKYDKVTNIWYNDVARERLSPFRTWIDEQTKPYDDYSTNDWYFEKDYSYDSAKAEFGDYANFDDLITPHGDLLKTYEEEDPDDNEKKERKDLITIGFYENRLKDLFVIRIPKKKAILHFCPLPNDDGMLSLFHSPWVLRSADSPYGLSMWEMIRQKKGLFDKMQNMSMDQLVLSIYKMFFYTGTSSLLGDGKVKIKPGVGHQIVNGKIDWMEVPGPGKEAFEGMDYLKRGIDDDSGVVPILEGDAGAGKTLGQSLHAKEAALKKMNIPVEHIAHAMEQDAYIALSWMSQIYSVPEVMEFAELADVVKYEQEAGVKRDKLFGQVDPDSGEPMGPFKATYMPELGLDLKQSDGRLVEAKENRFFQVGIGKDIKPEDMKWRGIFKVIRKSIVSSSAELDKQRKMEVFNILVPLLPQPPEIFAKAMQQILKVNEEDPADWLPKAHIDFLQQDSEALFVPASPAPAPGQLPGMGQGVPSNQTSMQGAAGTTPGMEAPTVVPQSQVAAPTIPGVNAAPRTELTRSV